MFLCRPLYALSWSIIDYRGYPYKVNFSSNYQILIASCFLVLWVIVFGYEDIIFGSYENIFYYFKRYSRTPEY